MRDHFADLVSLMGRRNAALWGECLATVGAVGTGASGRWVMATLSDGTTVLGEPDDFTVPEWALVDNDDSRPVPFRRIG